MTEQQAELSEKLKWLPLLFVIDERSQVSSKVLAAAEQNILECIMVGRIEKSSGEVCLPAVLLFGDDYLAAVAHRVQATDLADRSYNLHTLHQLGTQNEWKQ